MTFQKVIPLHEIGWTAEKRKTERRHVGSGQRLSTQQVTQMREWYRREPMAVVIHRVRVLGWPVAESVGGDVYIRAILDGVAIPKG